MRLLLLTLTLLLAACSQQDTPQREPLKIGINLWPGYAYAHIAEEKGLFKKHHAAVKLVFIPNYEDLLQSYRKNEIDGMFATLNDLIMLNHDGIATQVVYVVDYSDAGDVIVGRPELQSLSDLKGKTVSFEGIGSFSQLLVIKLLEKANVQEGEFKAVNLPTMQVLKALENGTIDAGHTWEPVVTQLLAKGYKILGKAGDIPGIIVDVLSMSKKAIDTRPQDVQGTINALVEAYYFLQTHRDEALSMMAKAQGISQLEMEQGVNNVHLLDLEENRAAMQSGGMVFTSWQISVDFFLQKGKLFKTPDLKTIINAQFVQAILSVKP